MTGNRTNIARLAASAAAVSLLLGGCGLSGGNDRPSSLAAKPVSGDKYAKAVAKAEQAVLASPRDAATRSALGNAYLSAGRFGSAAQSLNDALELGDDSVATVLALALAETARGNQPAALALLRTYGDSIPVSDLGLAYALAGDSGRGAQLLADAMRGGDASSKTRQNLAYALALNGQWAEAKVMVAQDVPADQVNPRIVEWVRLARPDAVYLRVAALLGVTPSADSGQPQQLALANFPSAEQLVREAQAEAPAPAPQAAPAPAPVVQAAVELPPVAPAAGPSAQPITLASADTADRRVVSDAPAFASIVLPASRPAAAPAAKPRTVGNFVAPTRTAVRPGKAKGLAAIAAIAKVSSGGSHWVQLGSYTDAAVAKEGWGKFTRRNPALKGFTPVTTTATVDGKPVWRVAASGFASYADAAKMCGSVRAKGGACLVKRAEAKMAPAAPVPAGGGQRLLRR